MNRPAPKTIAYRRLTDSALCERMDSLVNRVWECRRRSWNRKLSEAQRELQTALIELDRRM